MSMIFPGEELLEKIPSKDYDKWKLLGKKKKMSVWYSKGYSKSSEIPWWRASVLYPAKFEEVYSAIKDLKNYKNIFDRITESSVLDKNENIVYVRLDMPYFLSDRDYTVKYVENKKENLAIIQFYSVDYSSSPDNTGSVTLPRAAGKWIINFIPGKGTQVTYIWNGELLGKFPKSRLKDAWLEQGTEVLTWLYEYLRKNRVKQF